MTEDEFLRGLYAQIDAGVDPFEAVPVDFLTPGGMDEPEPSRPTPGTWDAALWRYAEIYGKDSTFLAMCEFFKAPPERYPEKEYFPEPSPPLRHKAAFWRGAVKAPRWQRRS